MCVKCHGLYGNTCVIQLHAHFPLYEFLHIIHSDCPNFVPWDVFPASLRLHPCCTSIAFVDQEGKSTIVWVIVEDSQEILLFLPCQNQVRTTGIDMDEFTDFLSAMFVWREWSLWALSNYTWDAMVRGEETSPHHFRVTIALFRTCHTGKRVTCHAHITIVFSSFFWWFLIYNMWL